MKTKEFWHEKESANEINYLPYLNLLFYPIPTELCYVDVLAALFHVFYRYFFFLC